MKSFKKKVAAIILIMTTLVVALPYYEFAQVYASSYVKESAKMDPYEYTSSPELAKKLKQVFEGNIGLYTSTKFSKSVKAPLGCTKLTGRNQYFIKGNATGTTNSGWQCYIYANAVYNTLYNEWVGRGASLKNSKVVIKGGSTFSYKQFVKAGVKCGAYARTTGNKNGSYHTSVAHSFVILGYNEEGVTYIEGNADGRGLVRVTQSTWKELNKAQTTGRGRYICHVVQPTDNYFDSLYGANTETSSGSASTDTKNKDTAETKTAKDPDKIKVSFSRTLSYTKGKKVLSGKDVLYMQTCMEYLGYTLTANSKYDSATAKAVKQFQKDKKLTTDGKIGSKTWPIIEKAVQAKKNSSKKVTVKFNANGGSGAPDNQKVQVSKATALSKTAPTRSGYTFLGWAKSQKATKADYKAGAKITVKADTTLYAVWKEEALAIKTQPADVKVSAGSKATFSVKATGRELSYQWYYKKTTDSEWKLWKNHVTASTTATANDTWNGMQVYCVVTDASGKSVSSESATVTAA